MKRPRKPLEIVRELMGCSFCRAHMLPHTKKALAELQAAIRPARAALKATR